jgi:hypothetical protein
MSTYINCRISHIKRSVRNLLTDRPAAVLLRVKFSLGVDHCLRLKTKARMLATSF